MSNNKLGVSHEQRNHMKVFLGGTCKSDWRDNLIPMLECNYFNPVVKDWTYECIKAENIQKIESAIHLYLITPLMEGVYSIAEAVYEACDPRKIVLFVIMEEDYYSKFSLAQIKSLDAVAALIRDCGQDNYALKLDNIADINKVAEFINDLNERSFSQLNQDHPF